MCTCKTTTCIYICFMRDDIKINRVLFYNNLVVIHVYLCIFIMYIYILSFGLNFGASYFSRKKL